MSGASDRNSCLGVPIPIIPMRHTNQSSSSGDGTHDADEDLELDGRATSLVFCRRFSSGVPSTLWAQSQLVVLRLRSCGLDHIDDRIGQLSNLRVLDVSWNLLVILPDTIGLCRHLEELDISFNKVRALPSTLADLSALWSISLHDNELATLPSFFGTMPSLREIDANYNRIAIIPPEIVASRSLVWVRLLGNPVVGTQISYDLTLERWQTAAAELRKNTPADLRSAGASSSSQALGAMDASTAVGRPRIVSPHRLVAPDASEHGAERSLQAEARMPEPLISGWDAPNDDGDEESDVVRAIRLLRKHNPSLIAEMMSIVNREDDVDLASLRRSFNSSSAMTYSHMSSDSSSVSSQDYPYEINFADPFGFTESNYRAFAGIEGGASRRGGVEASAALGSDATDSNGQSAVPDVRPFDDARAQREETLGQRLIREQRRELQQLMSELPSVHPSSSAQGTGRTAGTSSAPMPSLSGAMRSSTPPALQLNVSERDAAQRAAHTSMVDAQAAVSHAPTHTERLAEQRRLEAMQRSLLSHQRSNVTPAATNSIQGASGDGDGRLPPQPRSHLQTQNMSSNGIAPSSSSAPFAWLTRWRRPVDYDDEDSSDIVHGDAPREVNEVSSSSHDEGTHVPAWTHWRGAAVPAETMDGMDEVGDEDGDGDGDADESSRRVCVPVDRCDPSDLVALENDAEVARDARDSGDGSEGTEDSESQWTTDDEDECEYGQNRAGGRGIGKEGGIGNVRGKQCATDSHHDDATVEELAGLESVQHQLEEIDRKLARLAAARASEDHVPVVVRTSPDSPHAHVTLAAASNAGRTSVNVNNNTNNSSAGTSIVHSVPPATSTGPGSNAASVSRHMHVGNPFGASHSSAMPSPAIQSRVSTVAGNGAAPAAPLSSRQEWWREDRSRRVAERGTMQERAREIAIHRTRVEQGEDLLDELRALDVDFEAITGDIAEAAQVESPGRSSIVRDFVDLQERLGVLRRRMAASGYGDLASVGMGSTGYGDDDDEDGDEGEDAVLMEAIENAAIAADAQRAVFTGGRSAASVTRQQTSRSASWPVVPALVDDSDSHSDSHSDSDSNDDGTDGLPDLSYLEDESSMSDGSDHLPPLLDSSSYSSMLSLPPLLPSNVSGIDDSNSLPSMCSDDGSATEDSSDEFSLPGLESTDDDSDSMPSLDIDTDVNDHTSRVSNLPIGHRLLRQWGAVHARAPRLADDDWIPELLTDSDSDLEYNFLSAGRTRLRAGGPVAGGGGTRDAEELSSVVTDSDSDDELGVSLNDRSNQFDAMRRLVGLGNNGSASAFDQALAAIENGSNDFAELEGALDDTAVLDRLSETTDFIAALHAAMAAGRNLPMRHAAPPIQPPPPPRRTQRRGIAPVGMPLDVRRQCHVLKLRRDEQRSRFLANVRRGSFSRVGRATFRDVPVEFFVSARPTSPSKLRVTVPPSSLGDDHVAVGSSSGADIDDSLVFDGEGGDCSVDDGVIGVRDAGEEEVAGRAASLLDAEVTCVEYIRCVSMDGDDFFVPKEVACHSALFRRILDGGGEYRETNRGEITLGSIGSHVLNSVLSFCFKDHNENCVGRGIACGMAGHLTTDTLPGSGGHPDRPDSCSRPQSSMSFVDENARPESALALLDRSFTDASVVTLVTEVVDSRDSCTQPGPSRVRFVFELAPETVMETLAAAHYLEIPPLVEHACRMLADNLEDVPTLVGMPPDLQWTLLCMLDPARLLHVESSGKFDPSCGLDTSVLWRRLADMRRLLLPDGRSLNLSEQRRNHLLSICPLLSSTVGLDGPLWAFAERVCAEVDAAIPRARGGDGADDEGVASVALWRRLVLEHDLQERIDSFGAGRPVTMHSTSVTIAQANRRAELLLFIERAGPHILRHSIKPLALLMSGLRWASYASSLCNLRTVEFSGTRLDVNDVAQLKSFLGSNDPKTETDCSTSNKREVDDPLSLRLRCDISSSETHASTINELGIPASVRSGPVSSLRSVILRDCRLRDELVDGVCDALSGTLVELLDVSENGLTAHGLTVMAKRLLPRHKVPQVTSDITWPSSVHSTHHSRLFGGASASASASARVGMVIEGGCPRLRQFNVAGNGCGLKVAYSLAPARYGRQAVTSKSNEGIAAVLATLRCFSNLGRLESDEDDDDDDDDEDAEEQYALEAAVRMSLGQPAPEVRSAYGRVHGRVRKGSAHYAGLEVLDLSGNQINCALVPREAWQALKLSKTLRVLDLSDNPVGPPASVLFGLEDIMLPFTMHESAGVMQHLWNSLPRTLTVLCLARCRLEDEHIASLCVALEDNMTLTRLDLRGNTIGGLSCLHIAEMIERNEGLESLLLGDNEIGFDGSQTIAESLPLNTCLIHLDVSRNVLDFPAARSLVLGGCTATALRLLDVDMNDLTHVERNKLREMACDHRKKEKRPVLQVLAENDARG